MSTGHRILSDLGKAYAPGGASTIAPPASGGTFAQGGMAYAISTVGAGTYKLPDNGLPQYVRATGVVAVTSVAGTLVCSLTSGQIALCLPLTSTTWAASVLSTGVVPTQTVTKYATSSTATNVTPAVADFTGARHVYWENTADGALALTTPSAAALIVAHAGYLSAIGSYQLTIVNRGNNTITITGGDDVTVNGETTIATLVTRTYVMEFASADLSMRSVTKGTIET